MGQTAGNRLAVVGGNSFLGSTIGVGAPEVTVDDGTRPVVVRDLGDAFLLQRHGLDGYTPPHLIDHVVNLRALTALGCDRVLAINSTGGLRDSVGVGKFLLADDFVALSALPSTFGDERGHRVPGFDAGWRARVLDAWHEVTDVPLDDGGVYWQAIGPRLETAAEIRLMGHHADVVGMTMASECAVAGELGLAYASVCIVDNLANGVGESPLTWEQFEAGRDATQGVLAKVLDALVPALAVDQNS
jgi:5'-methylthioadenosine phosphorylase